MKKLLSLAIVSLSVLTASAFAESVAAPVATAQPVAKKHHRKGAKKHPKAKKAHHPKD